MFMGALKSSDVFVGIKKAVHMCRAAHIPRKDMRRLGWGERENIQIIKIIP